VGRQMLTRRASPFKVQKYATGFSFATVKSATPIMDHSEKGELLRVRRVPWQRRQESVALLFCAVSLCAAFTSPAVAFSKPALRSTSSAVRSAHVAPLRMNAGIEVIFVFEDSSLEEDSMLEVWSIVFIGSCTSHFAAASWDASSASLCGRRFPAHCRFTINPFWVFHA
jgi:hypothetical protein